MTRILNADALMAWLDKTELTFDGGVDFNELEQFIASNSFSTGYIDRLKDMTIKRLAHDVAILRNQLDGYAGEWQFERLVMPLSDSTKDCYRCSVCGTHWEHEFRYCPNCGAYMKGRSEK